MTWECVDVALDNEDFSESLVLENEYEQRVLLFYGYADDTKYFFSDREAAKIKQKYGAELWELILTGKVRQGMSEDVAILSWGRPSDINRTSTGGTVRAVGLWGW